MCFSFLIYSKHHLWHLDQAKEGYSEKNNLLCLLRLLDKASGSMSWPEKALSVRSETCAGDCGGDEEQVSSDAELCVVVEPSVFV